MQRWLISDVRRYIDYLMEAREEDSLLRLARILDSIGLYERLLIRDPCIETAFGGTGAFAIAEAEVFAGAQGCTFRYSRVKRQGVFTRSYPVGGRA